MNLTKPELDMLVEKWDKKGFKISEISDPNTARNTAMLLENEARYIVEAGSTLSTDVADFKKIVMPLTRRIFPNLIANDLVSVQPMSGPVGLAYALRFKYKTTTGSVTAGDEIGYNTVAQEYTGDVNASPTSGATGVATSAGELFSTGSPNQDIVEAGLAIETTTVTAKTRKIKSRWSLEAAQDLQNMHGIDIESEIISMLQYEIAAEIDREFINRMKALCTVGNGNLSTFVVDTSDGQWQIEKFRTLYTQIVKEANQIAITSRRGPGNFIVASSNVITALDAIGNFLLSPTKSSPMELAPGIAKVGSIEGRFDVYRDTFATSDYALVGYKGPSSSDAGIIYSPYVPIVISKSMDPASFYPVVGIMSRYGVTDNLFGAHLYYRQLNVDFTGVM